MAENSRYKQMKRQSVKWLLYFSAAVAIAVAVVFFRQGFSAKAFEPAPSQVAMKYYRQAQQDSRSHDLNSMLHNYYLFLRYAQDNPQTYGKELVTAYIDIGNLFVAHSDFSSAVGYYRKSYDLSQRYATGKEQMMCLLGLCQTSLYTGDTINARQWNRKILALNDVPEHEKLHLYYLNLASDHMLLNRLDSAKYYYQTDLRLIERHHIAPEEKYNTLMSLCKCYTTQNRLDSALHYALQSYDNSVYGDVGPLRRLFSMRKIAQLYMLKGDSKRAAYYQSQCYDLRDSVENTRDFLAIKSEQEQFEREQSRASIEQLTESNSRMQRLILLGVAAVALLAGFAYYVWRQKRRTEMNYRALFERNKELLDIEQAYKQRLRQANRTDQTAAEPAEETPQPRALPESDTPPRELDEALWQRILTIMDNLDELCSPEFGLIRLTALAESNTTYVSQTVKAATGKNVPAFINEYRIREACRRLLDNDQYGNLTLQALGESVGFTSQSTFNRAFKQSTGLTPAIYRRLSNRQSGEHSENDSGQ